MLAYRKKRDLNPLAFVTVVLGIAVFCAGNYYAERYRGVFSRSLLLAICVILAVPGILIALYYAHLWPENAAFYSFRSAAHSELTAAGIGFFPGVLASFSGRYRFIVRPVLAIPVVLGILLPHVKPLLGPISDRDFRDRWEADVCRQSTPSTCGAASAATILRQAGFPITEREVARECFSYWSGTENWYIARAFRRRGFRVRFRVTDGIPADLRLPAIAGVRFGTIGHFIPLLSTADGVYTTGDPLVGRKELSHDALVKRYHFTGFFMEIWKDG